MSRERHMHQIKLLDSTFGCEFDNALSRVMSHGGGLDWLTDEQVEEVRAEMIKDFWRQHQITRKHRRAA